MARSHVRVDMSKNEEKKNKYSGRKKMRTNERRTVSVTRRCKCRRELQATGKRKREKQN